MGHAPLDSMTPLGIHICRPYLLSPLLRITICSVYKTGRFVPNQCQIELTDPSGKFCNAVLRDLGGIDPSDQSVTASPGNAILAEVQKNSCFLIATDSSNGDV